MMQIAEQSRSEKIAMYMKLSKLELAQMLAERDMNQQPIAVNYPPSQPYPTYTPTYPHPLPKTWCGDKTQV